MLGVVWYQMKDITKEYLQKMKWGAECGGKMLFLNMFDLWSDVVKDILRFDLVICILKVVKVCCKSLHFFFIIFICKLFKSFSSFFLFFHLIREKKHLKRHST